MLGVLAALLIVANAQRKCLFNVKRRHVKVLASDFDVESSGV